MKRYTLLCATTALALAAFPTITLRGQQAPAGSPSSAGQEIYKLPAFHVSDDLDPSEKKRMATSTTRIAVDLIDVAQSISIIDPQMFQETSALRAAEAIKYVAGVTDSTLPSNVDRTQLRGFQGERSIRDGFEEAFLPGNLPLFSTDRIEIVKGPNPVISPAGPPGGTINRISKAPSFQSASSLTVALGENEQKFYTMLDSTGAVNGSKTIAYRAVVGYTRGSSYWGPGNPVESKGFYPSFLYKVSSGATLTLIGHFERSMGITSSGQYPLNPAFDDTRTSLSRSDLFPGYRLKFSQQQPDAVAFNYPHGHKYGVTLSYESTFGERTSTQLRARIMDTTFSEGSGVGYVGGNLTGGGAYNPKTGRYTPGITYGAAPDFAPIAVALMPSSMVTAWNTGNSADHHDKIQLNLRDDWAVKFGDPKGFWNATSLAGLGLDRTRLFYETRVLTRAALATPFDLLTFPDFSKLGALNIGAVNDHRDVLRVETSGYLFQNLDLWEGRIKLSGGVTYYSTDDSRTDNNLINPSRADWLSSRNVRHPTSVGVVVKPIRDVSVFYGHNSNVSAADMRNTGFADPKAVVSEGIQDEFGAKASLLKGRLFATVTHFKIRATNVQLPNSARIDNPDPSLPAFVFTDRVSKGWEFELSGKVVDNVNLQLSYSNTDIKNAFGQPVRNVAKNGWSIMGRYKTPIKGVETWLSADYLGRRAGDNPQDGYTAASTKSNLIIYQPRFYIPERTLANWGLSYGQKSWSAELYVSNIFDKFYVAGALTRTALYLGSPRQISTRFTYRF